MLKGIVLTDIPCSSFVVHVRIEAASWLTLQTMDREAVW